MATPHVAGLAGLLWSLPNAPTTNHSVRDKIESTAANISSAEPYSSYYWSKGRINACKAVGGTACDPDTSPPTVGSVDPANYATNVARKTSVTATFSEAMDPKTLTASTVTLTKYGSTTPISATVSYDEASKKVTLDPSSNLEASTWYVATIKGGTNGAKDPAGNALAADRVWYFNTGST